MDQEALPTLTVLLEAPSALVSREVAMYACLLCFKARRITNYVNKRVQAGICCSSFAVVDMMICYELLRL